MKIDDRTIKTLEIKATKYTVNDNGLLVNVYPNGTKTFAIRQQIDGKRFYKILGKYPVINVKQARQLYDQYYISREEQLMTIDRFENLCDLYISEKTKTIAQKTLKNTESIINKHIKPYFAPYLTNKISTNMVYRYLKTSEITVNQIHRVIQIMREIFGYGVVLGQIDKNPIPDDLTKMFVNENKNHRKAININNLDDLNIINDYLEKDYCCAIMLCVYSMLRINEVLSIEKSFIDKENMTITIPAKCMKMKRDFVLPITKQMNELIDFSKNKLFNFTYMQLYKRFKKTPVGESIDIHGFRATARTWLAEKGVQFEVAEMCLAHTEKSAVVRAYNRANYLEERRVVMQQWNDFVEEQLNKKSKE